jgi:predicted nucleic acid-binding protein
MIDQAEAIINSWGHKNMQLAAPMLFHYEIVAVMRKSVFQKLLSAKQAQQGLDILLSKDIQLLVDKGLLHRAYELATQFNRPTAYDSQYLAVAERLDCEFWTLDKKLVNAVSSTLPWVKWVGDFSPEREDN